MKSKHHVVIIGGGLAGLAAADALTRMGVSIAIVEASNVVGGRVLQGRSPLDGEDIELGAEFLHGGDAAARTAALAFNLPHERIFTGAHGDGGPDEEPAPDGGVALYYMGNERLVLHHDSADPGFISLGKALSKLSTLAVAENDCRTLTDYLHDEGVPSRMLGLARASYANTLGVGAALEQLPLAQVASLEAQWLADGEGDFRLSSGSLRQLCDALCGQADVQTNWQAKLVSCIGDGDGVIVTADDGRQVHGDAAVVAVPVTVLQSGELRFEPPLPQRKTDALRSITMLAALKIVAQFHHRPWGPFPETLHSMLCAECAIPEIWIKRTRSGAWLVSGFATGSYAIALAKLTKACAMDIFLVQLASVLPGALLESLRNTLVHSIVFNWAAHPFIRGGYSAPSTREINGARAEYRQPEFAQRIAFAGEASEDAMMTMNSALVSGRRAAQELAQSLLGCSLAGRARL
mmetsp:Transcript_70931/g.117855  ORF Transcript_70931/g.117855 Transcript_70931/m.117855 type:complete len:464 (+) Transcript_70931:55-1446(+)|eukprot:CAMPEP_0119318356 /NCGR_PEP_ID=MMETSP1333-20130426/46155_1 /TAXON_ID=418940 /ORGANISM="Scyphosphaera apsteinii, Strain RCC1455" /LENGTH=463 /DNA_ID=CAMNT_0007324509 /DNA_START=53 /DNA_END=1444 /DNA_ORIENTATION=+